MELKIGHTAPSFSLPDQDGTIHNLQDYKGSWVMLYFYPQDDTPGCTTQACDIRDNLSNLVQHDIKVFGISVDSVQSHYDFAKKYNLTHTLLADKNKMVVQQYGVWQEQDVNGQTSLGTARTTFIINPDGKIAQIYRGVDPESHYAQVLSDLPKLQQD